MRKFLLSLAAVATVAGGLWTPAAEAAPILSQSAVAASAQHALPTDQVRYRRRVYAAPRRHGPRVVYRTVYRTRYVYARPPVRRHRHYVRYPVTSVYDSLSYAPAYAAPVYVAPQVYPQTYYDTPAYVAPTYVAPVVTPGWGGGGGFAHRGGGGGGGGWRHHH